MQGFADGVGRLPEVQDTVHEHARFFVRLVINGEGEVLSQQAMVAEHLFVDSTIPSERIDLCKQAVQELGSQSFALLVVKPSAQIQVLKSRMQQSDLDHEARRRSSALAASHP